MTMIKCALDTNILIYSHDKANLTKQDTARNLIVRNPFVSTQTVSEYINVMKRLMPLSKEALLDLCMQTIERCTIYPVRNSTLKMAQQLIRRYDFQIFDSIIVAAALEAECNVLYSEDMQHNLKIENRLNIINPFIV